VKFGIEMSFKRDKIAGVSEPPRIDLCKPIDDFDYKMCELIFSKATNMLKAETFDEIYAIVDADIFSYYIDLDSYRQLEEKGDIQLLKEKLTVHYYAFNVQKFYTNQIRRRGRKGNRLNRFFEAITTVPRDAFDLADELELEYTTIKNHRRFDMYPERGITKIKNGKIFRQPKH
jgi:hypothetical protein